MEKNTREGRIRNKKKEVMVCVHYVVENKKFFVKFKTVRKKR